MYLVKCKLNISGTKDIEKLLEKYQMDRETYFNLFTSLASNNFCILYDKEKLFKLIEALEGENLSYKITRTRKNYFVECYSYVLKHTGKILSFDFCEMCPKTNCNGFNKKEVLDGLIKKYHYLLEVI